MRVLYIEMYGESDHLKSKNSSLAKRKNAVTSIENAAPTLLGNVDRDVQIIEGSVEKPNHSSSSQCIEAANPVIF